MYTASVLKAMLGQATTGTIPVLLIPTDRILQRWDVSNGTGLPTSRWSDHRISRPPPLDDDTATIVDQLVLHAPVLKRRLLYAWYHTSATPLDLAADLGLTPREVKQQLIISLGYMSLKFKENPNITLRRLLRIRE